MRTHAQTTRTDAARCLSARGVSVRFDGVSALKDVDIDIRRGELLGLIGPNGAGKTTLVNVLSGYQRAGEGCIAIDGLDITRWSPARRASAAIVRTFQGVRPFATLTTAENIEVAALSVGRRRLVAREQARNLLELMGLQEYRDRRASTLSYGSLRRLSIARALALCPDFLLLDEPAAGLDEIETAELGELLRTVRGEFGCGVLLIEHDVPLVMRICDRIHVLVVGATLRVGSPTDVANDPEVQAAYLGSSGVTSVA